MIVYIKSKYLGAEAVGTYDPTTKECVVLQGSKVSDSVLNTRTFRGLRSVIKLRTKYVKDGRVTEDVTFKSCSTASNFVTGRSTNGFRTWTVDGGKKLREYLDSSC